MRSMVVAGAHTPREKVFRPFFSCTTQCSPASFTRRVRAASPGGGSAQPSGAVRTVPSAARTVFGVGPGVKGRSVIVPPCGVIRSAPGLRRLAAEQRLLRVPYGEGPQRVGPTVFLQLYLAPATANDTNVSHEPAPVLLYRFDLGGVVGSDRPMPVQPALPAIRHRFGQLDIHDARPPPMPTPPRRRVTGPQVLGPPRSEMFGDFAFDLLHQPGPGNSNGAARFDELSEVVEVQIVRPEVGERVDAHDGVEEAGGERQRPGIGVDREHAVLNPDVPYAVTVFRGADPQVGRPHLPAEFPS